MPSPIKTRLKSNKEVEKKIWHTKRFIIGS